MTTTTHPATGVSADSDKASAGVELTVALAITAFLHWAVTVDAVKNTLPALPVLRLAWVFFLSSIGLAAWIRHRHGGDVSAMGLTPFRPARRLLLIGIGGFLAALIV